MTATEDRGMCPVVNFDHTVTRPVLSYFELLDDLRNQGAICWNTAGSGSGFWAVTGYEYIREIVQNTEIFTSASVDPFDPDPGYQLIPVNIDPPDHREYRRALNPWFSPGALEKIEPQIRDLARSLAADIAPRGGCNFVADYSTPLSAGAFMISTGWPLEDLPRFLEWVETLMSGFASTNDKERIAAAGEEIQEYVMSLVDDRRRSPRDPQTDFITYLLTKRVNDRELNLEEIISIFNQTMLGGFDTTRSQLAYLMLQLATHEDDRKRIASDASLIPRAVEESLRVNSILINDGRKVSRDFDFHGCKMKSGDMVWLSPASANRDPSVFPNPTHFELEREHNPHLSFGSGIHRCIGAHLARRELNIGVEEWHEVIPDYRLAEQSQIMERGFMLSISHLQLEWEVI
jgi:cytochrome P450